MIIRGSIMPGAAVQGRQPVPSPGANIQSSWSATVFVVGPLRDGGCAYS
jgi:hypothetical protein